MRLDKILNTPVSRRTALKAGSVAVLTLTGIAGSGCDWIEEKTKSEKERHTLPQDVIDQLTQYGYKRIELKDLEGNTDLHYVAIKKEQGDVIALLDTETYDIALLKTMVAESRETYPLETTHRDTLMGMSSDYLKQNEDPDPKIGPTLAKRLIFANNTLLGYDLKNERQLQPGTPYLVVYLYFENKKSNAAITQLEQSLRENPGFTSRGYAN